MKIIQRYQLFHKNSSYENKTKSSASKSLHTLDVYVYASKPLNATEWDLCIEIEIAENLENKEEINLHSSKSQLNDLTLSDIDTTDYAISHFTPEEIDDYESAPIMFYLSEDLILEVETKDQHARLVTKNSEHTLSYDFQGKDDLKGFITTLRSAVGHINDFFKSTVQEASKKPES